MDIKEKAKQLKSDIPAVFIALKTKIRQSAQKYLQAFLLAAPYRQLTLSRILFRFWAIWMT